MKTANRQQVSDYQDERSQALAACRKMQDELQTAKELSVRMKHSRMMGGTIALEYSEEWACILQNLCEVSEEKEYTGKGFFGTKGVLYKESTSKKGWKIHLVKGTEHE